MTYFHTVYYKKALRNLKYTNCNKYKKLIMLVSPPIVLNCIVRNSCNEQDGDAEGKLSLLKSNNNTLKQYFYKGGLIYFNVFVTNIND